MESVFSYIIGLGAAVMMPIIFTILGVCIGIKLSKALKSGLLVGVGFVGLSVVTALLTSSLGPALSSVVELYGLQLKVFDMGWPAAAAVAYNTSVGAFIIPVCLAVNIVMLLTKTTRTINIDLWNYWHYAFIGAVWKSHATLTPLAKQDLPTFGYNMIAPLKSWCWGSILFYPFKISRFS